MVERSTLLDSNGLLGNPFLAQYETLTGLYPLTVSSSHLLNFSSSFYELGI